MKEIKCLFLIFILVLLINYSATANSAGNDFNEIVFSIKHKLIHTPINYINGVNINSKTILIRDLELLFNEYNILLYYKAFPKILPDDSIRFTNYGKKINISYLNNIFVIKLNKLYDIEEFLNKMRNIDGIGVAEKNNVKIELCGDPDYSNQWYLKNSGQFGGKIGADINIEPVWQFWTGNNSKVAVIDGGVLLTHNELLGRVSGDPPANGGNYSDCRRYHGTFVAGIIGAIHNNELLIKGVNPNVQIISKMIFENDQYKLLSGTVIGNKIIDAVDEGAEVLNFSWVADNTDLFAVRVAFKYAYYMNRTCVCATGNKSSDINEDDFLVPVGWGPEIIAVGSSTNQDQRSHFSCYQNYIDIVAPGGNQGESCSGNNDDIFSISGPNNNSFIRNAGTSFSAPQVSGVASLMKSYKPELYNDDIQGILQTSAFDIATPGWDIYTGYGRLDANNAFRFIQSPFIIERYTTTGGIENTSPSDWYFKKIYHNHIKPNQSDLAGPYMVKRHLIKKDVNFSPKEFVKVWGRGTQSLGWYMVNPEHSTGFCGVLPNSLTNSSVTLYTFIYEVRSFDMQTYYGYYPCEANETVFAYSILSGPSQAPVITNISTNMIGDPINGYTLFKGQTGTLYPTIQGSNVGYNWNYFICDNTYAGQWPFDVAHVRSIYGQGHHNFVAENYNFTGESCSAGENLPSSKYLRAQLKVTNNYGEIWSGYYRINPTTNLAGGGCPYIFVLGNDTSGGKYFTENNILHHSEFAENVNHSITDVYKLKTVPKIDSNKITIQIMETENDVNYFDQIKLFAVDHPVGSKIGITESNDIVMYYPNDVSSSDFATQNFSANNIAPYIQYGQPTPKITGIGNDFVNSHYDSTSQNAKLKSYKNRLKAKGYRTIPDSLALIGEIGSDAYVEPIIAKDWAGSISIYTNSDTYVKPFSKRVNVSDVIIPFAQTNDIVDHVDINFNSDYAMSYFSVVPVSYEGFTKTELSLLSAVHALNGDILSTLASIDNNFAIMDTTAIIDLKFGSINPPDPSMVRDYVFVVNGKYTSDIGSDKSQLLRTTSNNNLKPENIAYKYKLNVNYPNPFNPKTKISYSLAKAGNTKLVVYDILGRLMNVIVNEYKSAGEYTVEFNGSHLSSGVYIYRLESNDFVDSKRMLMIK